MFQLQNELLDSWRDERDRSVQQDRVRAVDSRVLDTVGLADPDPAPDGRMQSGAARPDGPTGAPVPGAPDRAGAPDGATTADGSAAPGGAGPPEGSAAPNSAAAADADPTPRERAE
jgi:hypothetical protein